MSWNQSLPERGVELKSLEGDLHDKKKNADIFIDLNLHFRATNVKLKNAMITKDQRLVMIVD